MPQLASHNDCTGCMACYNACPKQAIRIEKDHEGFLMPCVDKTQCIGCKLCEKSCPIVSPVVEQGEKTPKVYAAWHQEDRRKSSSGAAFSAFARKTLENGGVVYGAAFDEKLHLRHIEVADIKGLEALRGSKYLQSEIGDIYRKVKVRLVEGRNVLFCGTPCQVAGLRAYLRKPYAHLLTIDLACHGVPSEAVFHSYLKKLENRLGFAEKGLHIKNYEFRRRDGWGLAPSISTMSSFTSPHLYNSLQLLYGVDALFMEAFNESALFRMSCYSCPFAKFPRIGDITLADFWGIGRHGAAFRHNTSKGVSLILVNSDQGIKAVASLDEQTFLEERSMDEALVENHNLYTPSVIHPKRDAIIADFLNSELSLNKIDKRYHIVDRSLKGIIKVLALRTELFDAVKVIYDKIKSL